MRTLVCAQTLSSAYRFMHILEMYMHIYIHVISRFTYSLQLWYSHARKHTHQPTYTHTHLFIDSMKIIDYSYILKIHIAINLTSIIIIVLHISYITYLIYHILYIIQVTKIWTARCFSSLAQLWSRASLFVFLNRKFP